MTQAINNSQFQHSSACILCPENCGITMQVQGSTLSKIRGDLNHPVSKGYICQKPTKLDYYQNHADRLTKPLKKRSDGSFQEVSWDQAISEVAAKLKKLRDQHGGSSLAYYGGGGQGNHLGGVYGSALRSAMKTRYLYSSLAQEKTGGFWVNGRMFGRQNIHPTEDLEHTDFALFIGTNPWHSHGFHHARLTLREIQKDPNRKMVVIDPRYTETAKMADVFIQVKPGRDAFLLAALCAIFVRDNLINKEFVNNRTKGTEQLIQEFGTIPIAEYAKYSGTQEETLVKLAHDIAAAPSMCLRTDLGLEHSFHSTLNGYLAKLTFLLTGHFGRKGCVNLHTNFIPLLSHSPEPQENKGTWKTRITGMHEITKMFPPNILPKEIDNEHPERIRGVFVDSSNPVLTAADSHSYLKAFGKLELLVVVDVAMTETAELTHYILPAASQFEKWEASFFNLGFPKNFFHLRNPLVPPKGECLPEPEIYARLIHAMGEIPREFPLLKLVAALDRRFKKLKLFPLALSAFFKIRPQLKSFAQIILYKTLGKALPEGAAAAAPLWVACQIYAKKYQSGMRRTGLKDAGDGLAESLFEKILESRSGILLSDHKYEEQWTWIRNQDHKIQLMIPELVEELKSLFQEYKENKDVRNKEFPFLLSAGGRRAYNANAIYRNPAWRPKEKAGSMHIHPEDAENLNIKSGDLVSLWCESNRDVSRMSEAKRDLSEFPHSFS